MIQGEVMAPVHKVLDDLCFVMECFLEQCFGDAKAVLIDLSNRLENDPTYAIDDRAQVASELRQALSMIGKGDRRAGFGLLSRISRKLWKVAGTE